MLYRSSPGTGFSARVSDGTHCLLASHFAYTSCHVSPILLLINGRLTDANVVIRQPVCYENTILQTPCTNHLASTYQPHDVVLPLILNGSGRGSVREGSRYVGPVGLPG
jgi:hypothetical protein